MLKIPSDYEIEFKNEGLKTILKNYYTTLSNRAFLLGELARIEPENNAKIAEFVAKMEETEAKTKGEASHKKADRQAKKNNLNLIEFYKFQISKLRVEVSDLYKQIDQASVNLEELEWDYNFAANFNAEAPVRELAYFEIEGTRYLAKDNKIVRNEKGDRMLFVENKENGEDNGTKTD